MPATKCKAMNIGSTIHQAFPFTVAKASLVGPDNHKTPHYGLFRSDNWECVGRAVSKTYHPHTTEDVVTLAEAAAQAFQSDIAISTYWHQGHHLTIAPSKEYRRTIFGTGDAIWPRLVISARYDGKCFVASLGMFRDICSNLAIVKAHGIEVSASIRHCKGLRDHLEEIRYEFSQLVNKWEGVHQTAQDMERRVLDVKTFIKSIYTLPQNATPRIEQAYSDRASAILSRILRERAQLRGSMGNITRATAWELFNGVQGYVQHDLRRKGKPSEIARAMSALNDKNVAKALELALAS